MTLSQQFPAWSCAQTPGGDYLITIQISHTKSLSRRVLQFEFINLANPATYLTFFILNLHDQIQDYLDD